MKDETRQILNDPALLAARESHFGRLKTLFAGRTLDRAFVLCGAGGRRIVIAGDFKEPLPTTPGGGR